MIRRESIWRPLQCRVWWTHFYSRLLNCIRDSCITVKTLNKRSTNTSGVSVMTLQCPPTFPEFTHPSPRWDCAMYWAANNDKNLGFLCSRHLAKKPLHACTLYVLDRDVNTSYDSRQCETSKTLTLGSFLQPGSPTLRVLHISDIHNDPLYEEGSDPFCGEPLCCRKDDPTPGKASLTLFYVSLTLLHVHVFLWCIFIGHRKWHFMYLTCTLRSLESPDSKSVK